MEKLELTCNENNLKKTINEDWLGRNKKLINLIKLLNNITENFILSIDGEWGSGKTFFIKQLKYICDNSDKIEVFKNKTDIETLKNFSGRNLVIYYNAWENDHHGNALESLIYNILNEYPQYKKDIENPKKLFGSIKPILMNIIDKGTLGIISKECFNEINSFEDLAKNIFTLEETIQSLNKLFDIILKENERLLLIIDELDRCRPDFAVNMLETLKHFYNNPKLTIIVVTNNRQLSHTIKKYYGSDFDGYSYLNKIYDTVISLEVENLDNYLNKYCQFMQSTNLPENMSVLLFKFLHFSYRECNKYISMYRIVEPYTNYKSIFNTKGYLFEADILMPIALALKIRNIDEYNKFINGNNEQFIKELLNSVQYQNNNELFNHWFKSILSVADDETIEESFIKRYKALFSKELSYEDFPYLEAISMLGNSINFSEENK